MKYLNVKSININKIIFDLMKNYLKFILNEKNFVHNVILCYYHTIVIIQLSV